MSSHTCDAVVIGGGPAGCAAALTLAQAGATVALIGRSRDGDLRRGETVPPTIRRPLEQLGQWDRFIRSGPRPSPGIESYWGTDRAGHRDFMFHPLGSGWHLDRASFDAMLADSCVAGGVELRIARAVDAHEASGRWHVSTTGGSVQSKVLVNAAGRRAGFSMPALGPRWVRDHTVAMGQVFEGRSRSPWTLIETSPAGWAYWVPLPGKRQVVVFFADPDAVRAVSFRELLAALPHTCRRLDAAVARGPAFHQGAGTWCRSRVSGATWLCIGDAASTVDPLSGKGISRALTDGIVAGRACLAMLEGDTAASERFQSHVHRRFAADCQTRLAYYRAESRWPDATFWQRRQRPDRFAAQSIFSNAWMFSPYHGASASAATPVLNRSSAVESRKPRPARRAIQ